MSDILTSSFFISLLSGTIRVSIPILLAALGDVYVQRAGILNLGLEGTMLMGALAGFAGVYFTGSLMAGLLAAVLVCVLFSLIMAFLSITIKCNQVIAGTAITILGTGLSAYLFRVIFGIKQLPPTVKTFPPLECFGLADLPFIGPILFNHNAMVYIGLALVVVTAFVMNHTTFGLKVKAVGEHPRAADSKGIHVARIRYICLMIEGAYAGLAGAFLSIGYMNTFMDGMIRGRGFIAVAVVIFARWNPWLVLCGALLFGGADSLQMRLQAIGVGIPNQFLLMFPYVLTIITLVFISRKAAFPSAYTLPYTRSGR